MAVATDTQNQGGFRMQFPHLLGLIYHVFNGDHAQLVHLSDVQWKGAGH
jgi:hypothetical protein